MRSLGTKLILAFLVVSLAGVGLAAFLAGRATANEFGHFMFRQGREDLVTYLADYYQTHASWQGLAQAIPRRGGMDEMMGGIRGPGPGSIIALADQKGVIVLAGAGYQTDQIVSSSVIRKGTPVTVSGQRVGTLIEGPPAPGSFSQAGQDFLNQVNLALVVGSIAALGLALVLGLVLTRAFTRPLRELTDATRALAAGDLGRKVEVRSHDELGELAASFNQMSADLARARDWRRQMTADIAHELRTPLTLVLGHAEALRDGVLPPDEENLRLIHEETGRLTRLVEDLRTLSLAEAGELPMVMMPMTPMSVVRRAVAAHKDAARRSGVALDSDTAEGLPEINGDPDRLSQVMDNLLDNALRHTPSGGRITVSAEAEGGEVCFRVADTGPGIKAGELERVFERFYRADNSRSRENGGSGLGLAIARSIVEAHGGQIGVENGPVQGAVFWFSLPKIA